jgi:serine/threonine-protein kinase
MSMKVSPVTQGKRVNDVKQLGPYKILERIGSGGMATVYRAEMQTNDGVQKIVALKVLHPHLAEENSFVKMFMKECELAVDLRHENVISPFDFGLLNGQYYMAMDYYRGLNLRSILETLAKQNLNLSINCGIYVLSEVLLGLRYAHRFTDRGGRVREVIHRDVSPQNILVTTDGDVRLIDFGIAKILGETGLTDVGTIKGKLQYMSPEQAGGKDLDHRTDLYSLSVVGHEVFTGELLFPSRDPTRVLRQIQLGDSRFSPEFHQLPNRLQKVMKKSLHRNPSKRHSDAKGFREDLLDVARRELKEVVPKKTRKELGMLVRSLIEPLEEGVEEVRLSTSLLESGEQDGMSIGVESAGVVNNEVMWPRFFVYGCAGLLVLALLFEIFGVDIRPVDAQNQVATTSAKVLSNPN